MAFDFSDDVRHQDIKTGGPATVRVHLAGLSKRCTGCGKTYELIKGFGQLRRMKPDEYEYRPQPRCKSCRGAYND